jgi:mRNA interferase MazF
MNSERPYCPDRFDIIHLHFDPQAGCEQAGKRYAFVLSPRRYNRIARLCVLCPLTTQIKGYPFECATPQGGKARGVVLADQVKSLDRSARDAEYLENRPDIAGEVMGKLRALLPFDS